MLHFPARMSSLQLNAEISPSLLSRTGVTVAAKQVDCINAQDNHLHTLFKPGRLRSATKSGQSQADNGSLAIASSADGSSAASQHGAHNAASGLIGMVHAMLFLLCACQGSGHPAFCLGAIPKSHMQV